MRAVREGFEAYVAVDASGTFDLTKRETGIARLNQSGVVVSDGASLMVEILADNASPKAFDVYSALDMDWSVLVSQVRASAIEWWGRSKSSDFTPMRRPRCLTEYATMRI